MNRLRAWFLAPSWIVMGVLFLAPLAVIFAYSLLTRGVYGGIARPWTAESYQRLADPIYLESYGDRFGSRRCPRFCAWRSDFRWRCSFRGRAATKIFI